MVRQRGYKGVSAPQKSPHGRASRIEREVFGNRADRNTGAATALPHAYTQAQGEGLFFV